MPARKPETTVTALVPARVQEGSLITEDDGLLFHVGIGHHNIWVAGTTFDQHESTLCDPDMRVVSSEKRTLRWIERDLGAKITCPRCVEILMMPYSELHRLCSPAELQKAIDLPQSIRIGNWIIVEMTKT
jgi:hypothetical protein